jgi:hypothetical protein
MAADRDHGEPIHRRPEHSTLALADPDHPEVYALNLDDVFKWTHVPEERVRDIPPEEDDGSVSLDLDGTHHAALFRVEAGEVEVSA